MKRSAFTLIELLLVVFIMMLAALVAMPAFVRSFRGAKLRASARTVVMVHRHARSMAVLGQKYVGVSFDKELGRIDVISVQADSAGSAQNIFLDQGSSAAAEPVASAVAEAPPPPPTSMELTRTLEDKVKISDFEFVKGGWEHDDIFLVTYYPNGMCDEYNVRLEDEDRKSATLEIDSISGKVKVEYGN